MKKILLILSIIFLASCHGLMWDGVPRNSEDDTMDVTVVIEDPLWDTIREYRAFVLERHEAGDHSYCYSTWIDCEHGPE